MSSRGGGGGAVNDTRERIIAAATELATQGFETRPSVRAVAAHAGVGASTLRHYFPSQRDLFDAVLQRSFEKQYPDERIHDASVPARERLLECLTNLLTPIGEGEQAREFWMQLFNFASTAERTQTTTTFTNLTRVASTRVESWLEVLEDQGAISPGDRARRALFLLTLIDGLAIGRALPAGSSDPGGELGVLEDAVDAVLRSGRTSPA